MTTSDSESIISSYFSLSEYDMTSDREANKHEFFKANTTGLQGRDLISVNFSISEYEYLTRGRVTAGSLERYKSALPVWIWSIS